ncbi:hypothetical protein A3I27_03280 [Candidatus Giovannonibacteria bacterium RIFCSPLOWO2_02_FULL_43_11b]|uniref:Uncharacterized protein n=1 Tax=Candidatus Giovannonibacteria bacterium RIFCSPHIGHO2_12_FULL_43_15 TaxID=1798341 RepID=A0A1F5WNU8_9BACT|nr:MAG: hypothetical protein A2739_02705 [Candidatus Giovannonibacteria bacterium RIFCSPHIGHO2_01_FULL_43_100]OGF66033.1 MAG: hypothetical protein A3B97_01480 [Candidatus Giovannonibacteria bacterium RIFCSPHIGHO2_02_FULL_43_32]OGF77300.1 MAG: hypothetical protein A3F23_00400 [Candidatus Giovannonibacteria bacterium RIFCSPHIGHO2_12_FULL_43_15]OGF78021.1 MAG: hypothetical protein A3A15_01185 [Candidatus Giovannonibacteria bacterium RIFCSPLOWO2_01_FULL_43_60]OGF89744.1 MAG: hypothetical protein A3
MKYIRIYLPKEEKLLPLIIITLVFLLGVYIMTLNTAVSDNFHRGEIDREARSLRQDIQDQEEVFITSLSGFYDQYSASFEKKEIPKQEFVSRESNFALSSLGNLR